MSTRNLLGVLDALIAQLEHIDKPEPVVYVVIDGEVDKEARIATALAKAGYTRETFDEAGGLLIGYQIVDAPLRMKTDGSGATSMSGSQKLDGGTLEFVSQPTCVGTNTNNSGIDRA